MTTDRDDAPVRRYRQASAELDERPSDAVRAAILAAAARQVSARPQAADAPRPVFRRRWPLGAAAAVLLSTLAVMMATRTEQEMPAFTAPAERATETAPASPAPPPAPAPAIAPASPPAAATAPPLPPASAPADTAGSGAAPQAPGAGPGRRAAPPEARALQKESARERRVAAAPPAVERQQGANGTGVAADPASAGAAPSDHAPASAEAPAAPPAMSDAVPSAAAPAAKRAGPAAQGGLSDGSISAAKPEAGRAAERAVRREAAPAAEPVAPEPASAQEWLERIVKLRLAARHGEADAELKRFRERYPAVQIPPEALGPGTAGTR